jgi:hypothetical protein
MKNCSDPDPGWKNVQIRIQDPKIKNAKKVLKKSAHRNMGWWVPKDAEFYVDKNNNFEKLT